jgi:AcrR family transcriptional regulator
MVIEKHFETLKKMFFEEGIKQLTIEIVCHRLGIAKKTFYKDFKNKRELVNAIFRKEFFGLKQELTSALNQSNDAIEQLCTLFKFLSLRQDTISYATLLDLSEYYQPLNSEIIILENQLILDLTLSILNQGISELIFREDIMPERIGGIFAFLFMTGIILKKNKIQQDLFSFSNTNLFDFHMRSICTSLGLKLWNTKYLVIQISK